MRYELVMIFTVHINHLDGFERVSLSLISLVSLVSFAYLGSVVGLLP